MASHNRKEQASQAYDTAYAFSNVEKKQSFHCRHARLLKCNQYSRQKISPHERFCWLTLTSVSNLVLFHPALMTTHVVTSGASLNGTTATVWSTAFDAHVTEPEPFVVKTWSRLTMLRFIFLATFVMFWGTLFRRASSVLVSSHCSVSRRKMGRKLTDCLLNSVEVVLLWYWAGENARMLVLALQVDFLMLL